MIKFDKIKAGDVLYDVMKLSSCGITTCLVFQVDVLSVDSAARTATVSRAGKDPTVLTEEVVCRLRRTNPRLKGMR